MTGLEPATFGVTGRHSNQLSYTRAATWETGKYGRVQMLSTTVCAKNQTLFAQKQDRYFDQFFDLLNEAGRVISVDYAMIATDRDIH